MIEYAPMPPVGYIPPLPAKPRRPTGFIVLVILSFVAATVFAVLYVLADRNRDMTAAALAARRTELTTAKQQAGSAEADQASIEQDNDELADDNATLETCVDAVHHYLWDNLTEAETTAALNRMVDACQ